MGICINYCNCFKYSKFYSKPGICKPATWPATMGSRYAVHSLPRNGRRQLLMTRLRELRNWDLMQYTSTQNALTPNILLPEAKLRDTH